MVSALLKELCFRVSFAEAETVSSQMLPSRPGPPIPLSRDTPETRRVRTPASMLPGWDHHNSTLKMRSPERHHLWQGHWHSQGMPVNSARARTSQWLHLGTRAGKKGQGPCRYHKVTDLGDRFMSVYETSRNLPNYLGKVYWGLEFRQNQQSQKLELLQLMWSQLD